jgi:hypothetical protein
MSSERYWSRDPILSSGNNVTSKRQQYSQIYVFLLFSTSRTATKTPFMYFRKGIARPQSQFPHVSVSDLYIPGISPHIFPAAEHRKTDPGNIYIAHRYFTWKLGLRPHNSFSWNICFEFSVLCLCSAFLILRVHLQFFVAFGLKVHKINAFHDLVYVFNCH